ncbi:hypothetical protein JTE90_023999 [Oedothorax gibbosus]|uniref:Uncharacterized protein n=1 Tax=Oedothorax gibbosus TaxID=931172 RepID=A0AAV6TIE5_9ARAC|nr:hypothetical protein JTE90_023999 [Oedothorax gibbosus]
MAIVRLSRGNQHLSCGLMSVSHDPFKTGFFGFSSTAPVLLTKSGPLGNLILSRPAFIMQCGLPHPNLKFENRLRSFRPQGL